MDSKESCDCKCEHVIAAEKLAEGRAYVNRSHGVISDILAFRFAAHGLFTAGIINDDEHLAILAKLAF